MTLHLFSAPAEYDNARDCWATPASVVRGIERALGVSFELDVCAHPATAKAPRFFTAQDDGLAQPWKGVCWCNPPFSKGGSVYDGHRGIAAWAYKALDSLPEARVALLAPSDLRFEDREALSWASYAIPLLRRVAFMPPSGVEPSTPNFGVHLHLYGAWDAVPRLLDL